MNKDFKNWIVKDCIARPENPCEKKDLYDSDGGFDFVGTASLCKEYDDFQQWAETQSFSVFKDDGVTPLEDGVYGKDELLVLQENSHTILFKKSD